MPLYRYKTSIPRIHPEAFIAPSAQIIGKVSIGCRSSVWFQTVIRGDMEKIDIGENTNIQDLTACHADQGIPLTVGNGITIGHRSVIHGCTIEDHCLVGMGAVIMNRAVIGRGSVVAAGSVVLENTVIPPYSLVAGSPARVKKRYENQAAIEKDIQSMARIYMDTSVHYKSRQDFYEVAG